LVDRCGDRLGSGRGGDLWSCGVGVSRWDRCMATEQEDDPGLQTQATNVSSWNDRGWAELVIGVDEVGLDGTNGEVIANAQIDSAASKHTEGVVAAEEFGCQAITAEEDFSERGEVAAAQGELRSSGDVVRGELAKTTDGCGGTSQRLKSTVMLAPAPRGFQQRQLEIGVMASGSRPLAVVPG
jgi:hypothetical protein